MYLLIDQGNSQCKYLLTRTMPQLDSVEYGSWGNQEFNDEVWKAKLTELTKHQPKRVLVSSVASEERKQWFSSLCKEALGVEPEYAVSSKEYTPIHGNTLKNRYSSPQALGVDRWLAMVGVAEKCHGSFAVIDAGTAVTLDLVDNNGKHLGGHIVPGRLLLQKTLMGDTGGIAWSAGHDKASEGVDYGENTRGAVELGCRTMLKGYIREISTALLEQEAVMKPLTIYITGGDGNLVTAVFTDVLEKNDSMVKLENCPKLIFEGLSYWFSLNN